MKLGLARLLIGVGDLLGRLQEIMVRGSVKLLEAEVLTPLHDDETDERDSVRVQPRPKGSGRDIADMVVDDIAARKRFGVEKYGEPLRAFNGRDGMTDAYQEAIDLVLYLKKVIVENRVDR